MNRIPVYGKDGIRCFALVDDGDDHGHRWNLDTKGYVVRTTGTGSRRRRYKLHREVLGLTDPEIHGDHINGDKLDNRRSNLRIASQLQNMQNVRLSRRNKSGVRGVFWRRDIRKWTAEAMVGGKTHRLGFFVQLEEAAAAVTAFRAQHMPFSADAREAA